MAVSGLLLLALPPVSTSIAISPEIALISVFTIFGCTLVFGAWWIFQLWRQQGRLLLRIEPLEQNTQMATADIPELKLPSHAPELIGQPVPALTLRDVTNQRIDLRALYGRPTLLLFLDATCQHCRPLLSHLRTWRPAANIIVILAGQQHPTIEFAPDIVVVTSDVQRSMQAFGVLSTPTAIAIGADGIVAEPAARGNAAVGRLMDRMTEQPREVHHELATV